MKQSERIIKVLQESSGEELPRKDKQYIRENTEIKNLIVCVSDCIRTSIKEGLPYTSKTFWVQDGKEIKENSEVDISKAALILFPEIGDSHNYYVFLYKPKSNKSKTKIIYGIRTTDDEYGRSSVKAYCSTYDIALRESKKYYDWYCGLPVGAKGIEAIELIIE